MPPRIRTRATKAQKENIDTENKVKTIKTNTKAPRKVLADKTNSASDSSVEVSKAPKKAANETSKDEIKRSSETKNEERPRRNRRLPPRYVENPVLSNLSHNSKNSAIFLEDSTVNGSKPKNVSKKDTPVKKNEPEVSPFKTPGKADSSLVISRPRRICRLPSRFDDHSVSPNKYIPIQPDNASTPIQQSKSKPLPKNNADQDKKAKKSPQIAQQLTNVEKVNKGSKAEKLKQTTKPSTRTVQTKMDKNSSSSKSTPDSNNNAKGRSTRSKKAVPKLSPKRISPKINSIKRYFNKTASPIFTPTKKVSPEATKGKRVIDKSLSFKVLGGTKKSQEADKNDLDIYEFTFDPSEEPKPQKKTRKKPAVKKSAKVTKPKAVVTYKSTYDKNISKALLALKNAVKSSKPAASAKLPHIQEALHEVAETDEQNHVAANNISTCCKTNKISAMNNTGKASVHECNYPSIRVEDIAADIEPSIDHHDDFNYSPVNSPRPASPNPLDPRQSPERVPNNDPLNLQEELSFFDDVPVASSSMNVSVRHPTASPWRVEFGSLPIKWHSNTYVKPNMTPAVECSFICSEDSNKKRHVYTNIVPETNDSLPQIVNDTPNLKQTSIISFIREVAEKQMEKKRGRSVSPSKAFGILNSNNVKRNSTPKKNQTDTNNDPLPIVNTSEELSSNNDASDKENSKEKRKTRKRKNDENVCDRPAKSPRKQKDKDCTYFGFDDSENQDIENVSPGKARTNVRGRSLRSRSRVVLQEINGPTRAALPIAAKSKLGPSSEVINKVFEQLKSAADAPAFPEKNVEQNVTNIEEISLDDDAESVHLFEDIEVVHHLKPTRKSYGKAKKVTFQQHSTSDGESQEAIACRNNSSFEDDLGDLTFEVPNVKEKKKSKKKKPKKLMSKKEEKEAEEWAAGFNSMCEEVEDFPLVVE